MISTRLTSWAGVAVLAGMVGSSHAEPPVMRDATTHDQLVLKLRQAEQKDPMKHMATAKGTDPAAVFKPKDLLSQSDIIAFQGLATLVPKRAILQIPKNYQDRIAMQPGAKIVGWEDFFVANRGWITTVEVSRPQAEGTLALPDETKKQMKRSGNLVVATYMGGPISVLPPLKALDKNDAGKPAGAASDKPADTQPSKPETPDTQIP